MMDHALRLVPLAALVAGALFMGPHAAPAAVSGAPPGAHAFSIPTGSHAAVGFVHGAFKVSVLGAVSPDTCFTSNDDPSANLQPNCSELLGDNAGIPQSLLIGGAFSAASPGSAWTEVDLMNAAGGVDGTIVLTCSYQTSGSALTGYCPEPVTTGTLPSTDTWVLTGRIDSSLVGVVQHSAY
ncbi:MAG: hypothetical protein ACYDBQ_12040 [Thermoplasmatota archaeon]